MKIHFIGKTLSFSLIQRRPVKIFNIPSFYFIKNFFLFSFFFLFLYQIFSIISAAPLLSQKNVVLIGFKSSGKSTVGKLLAEKLQMDFIDTDILIQDQYKKKHGFQLSMAEIHKNLGEKKFRTLESKVISELELLNTTVISTGGGAVIDSKNIDSLKHFGYIVFLDASLPIIIERINKVGGNIFLGTNKSIDQIFKVREGMYKSSADFSVKIDNLSVDEIVNKIILHLKKVGVFEFKKRSTLYLSSLNLNSHYVLN